MSSEIARWLLDSFMLFLEVSLGAILVYALLLFLRPALAFRWQTLLNYRVSGRRLSRPLEIPHHIEPFFYRHAKVAGGLLLAGAALLLWLTWRLPTPTGVGLYPLWPWLREALGRFLWLAGILIFIIGLVVLYRPSLLKTTEAAANRWVSTRRGFYLFNKDFAPLDRAVQARPRVVGLVLIACTLLTLQLLLRT